MPERHTAQADVEAALIDADAVALSARVGDNATTVTISIGGLPPLLALLRRSTGIPSQVRDCVQVLLDAGADPDSHTVEWGGEGRKSALFEAVERQDLDLVRLLVDHGATKDEDAFYQACEQSNTALFDLLYQPGFEAMVNHKLDFEDAAGLRWFLHAACYDRMTAPLERQVLQPRRVAPLSGLGGRVLDVGAGTGANLPYLRAATEVVAAEPDAAMRRQLARRVVDAPVPVEVSDTTAEALRSPTVGSTGPASRSSNPCLPGYRSAPCCRA